VKSRSKDSAKGAGAAIGPGTIVGGRYELIEEAGRGGMATVWRAHLRGDSGFTRTVAVKQMHPALAEQPLYVSMFAEEARIGAQLEDANLAQAYDFVHEHGQYFLVMEWIEGLDLGSYIHYYTRQGARTRWELVVAIGIGLLRGLAAAHERHDATGAALPIVHRDVSPHNVLLTVKGKVKLIDFGLALAHDTRLEKTEPGIVKGKMSYLSPEVVAGGRPSPETDQFAAAAVLWEALVGRKLFDGGNDFETFKKLRDGRVQPLRPLRPDIPKELVTVINKALSPEVAQRFPSAREMARELLHVLKEVRERKDFHVALGRTVTEARAAMGMGRRTGDPSTTTPIAELEELAAKEAAKGKRAGTAEPPPGEGEQPRRAALWHRLGFGRRK
jgi:eukaryotic-like serine/threonine-protein kinase